MLDAAYDCGLATALPYADGNTHAAFLAMVIFLDLNGQDHDATETEVVTVIVALAAGHLTEAALADWLRPHLIPLDDWSAAARNDGACECLGVHLQAHQLDAREDTGAHARLRVQRLIS